MNGDQKRIDDLIRYSLLLAGEQDGPFDRQLGPIHILKYVYLGDLAYARRSQGQGYTGIVWQFYRFGPWSAEVHARIEPALLAIGAQAATFPSDYDDKEEWTRWSLRDSDLLRQIERDLPAAITLRLSSDVRQYGKDTPSLLHYVYQTPPMLAAAPSELLDLRLMANSAGVSRGSSSSGGLRADSLSNKKRKELAVRIAGLRDKAKARGASPARLVDPVPTPRYDETYENGFVWLESLAGESVPAGEKTVHFTDDVWRSEARKGDDVP